MTLTELQSLTGSLCNDPNHDRYSLSDINTELNNSQDTWNLEAKIIKATTTLTVAAGQMQYGLFALLSAVPLSFTRVTHKGIDLEKRSKSYFDHLSGRDWTQDIGTPTEYFIEMEDTGSVNNTIYLSLHPTPQSGDIGANLVVSYIIRHTAMSEPGDLPFASFSGPSFLLRPYDWGLAYSVASKLLLRDPSNENNLKSNGYAGIAKGVLAEVVQVYKALEAEEPKRISGGRYWRSGNAQMVK